MGRAFGGGACRQADARCAAQVPSEYTPVDYTTKALQQTRVTLTWDADDPERKKQLRRKLTSEQLRDEDFAAYLGSGSEDEQDEGEKEVRSAAALSAVCAALTRASRSPVRCSERSTTAQCSSWRRRSRRRGRGCAPC